MRNNNFQARTRIGRAFLIGMIVLVLLLSGCATQEAAKVYHVGILYGIESQVLIAESFQAAMAEKDYIEDENIIYDIHTNTDPAEQQSILEKFVEDEVDLILAFPDGVAIAAKATTAGTDIPVIFASSFSELNDLVESVSEPGGNITGVRVPGPEITLKTQKILLEVQPDIKRIWVAYDPDYPPNGLVLDAWRPEAASLGVTLVEIQVKSPEEIQVDLQARAQSDDIGMDAMIFIADVVTRSPEAFETIVQFGREHNIPVAGGPRRLMENGIILAVSTDHVEQGQLAATLADQIFAGAEAGTLPVLTPDTLLSFNYKVAQELGLTVPDEILEQANEIIR